MCVSFAAVGLIVTVFVSRYPPKSTSKCFLRYRCARLQLIDKNPDTSAQTRRHVTLSAGKLPWDASAGALPTAAAASNTELESVRATD